jgi:hypothetical protein
VVLLKDTALGFLITYNELLYYARYIGAQPVLHRPLIPVTIVVAAMYIALNLLLSLLATYLERRNRRSSKHIVPPVAARSRWHRRSSERGRQFLPGRVIHWPLTQPLTVS